MKPTTLLILLLSAFCLALGANLYQSESRLYSLMTDGCVPSYAPPDSLHPGT